jgi:cell wall-associated NlpC family hydrolase
MPYLLVEYNKFITVPQQKSGWLMTHFFRRCMRTLRFLLLLALLLPAGSNAAEEAATVADPIGELLNAIIASSLPRLGYTIQVGAFANLDNAVRLDGDLDRRGIESFYFRHDSGLYKVRFGNFKEWREAQAEAVRLRELGVIADFYIVAPQEYAIARIDQAHSGDLRDELLQTARRYLGIPYRWGGVTDKGGFDCSGLTMVCYRLNGLNLPRISQQQYGAGQAVSKEELRLGDLVFFATRKKGVVSHVGLYIGENRFIHAPRTGENVQIESLLHPYYAERYLGARSYF